MNFLVTGSSGFIGKHLKKTLEQQGHVVIPFDLQTGENICDYGLLEKKINQADAVFHLAAVASVQKSFEDPKGTYDINVNGTRNVFEAAYRAGNIPVIYASSAAVYGDNQNLPLSEKETPQPLSPYAEHKLQNEIDAKKYGEELGLKTFGVRFFNIYGHGQDPASPYSGVISIFHDKLRQGRPLTLYGDGEQSRDFVAVEDAVNALIRAHSHADNNAPVCNICTGQTKTLNELIDILAHHLNSTPQIHYSSARKGDILHSCGNPDRFMCIASFKPEISLHDGMQKLTSFSMQKF